MTAELRTGMGWLSAVLCAALVWLPSNASAQLDARMVPRAPPTHGVHGHDARVELELVNGSSAEVRVELRSLSLDAEDGARLGPWPVEVDDPRGGARSVVRVPANSTRRVWLRARPRREGGRAHVRYHHVLVIAVGGVERVLEGPPFQYRAERVR